MDDRETTGGLFWDVLLLSEYNEHWISFYESLIRVLPCEKCVNDSIKHHKNFPVPKLHNTKEKNQYLWSLRTQRGNAQWNKKVKKGEYTLETWINQFKNKPFRKLN